MKLPTDYLKKNEWLILGPMGPSIPEALIQLPTLAVDGGANFCEKCDIWIGDGDSFEKEVNSPLLQKYPKNKSLSDLALALEVFKVFPETTLHLWGFGGGRSDHFLFNIGECLQYLKNNPQSKIYFYDKNLVPSFLFFPKGAASFTFHGTFSVGSIYPFNLSLSGDCAYQASEAISFSPLSSLGLSNMAKGTVNLLSDGPFFIHLVETP